MEVGQGVLEGVTKVVVETEEGNIVCIITGEDIDPVEGYRVRLSMEEPD